MLLSPFHLGNCQLECFLSVHKLDFVRLEKELGTWNWIVITDQCGCCGVSSFAFGFITVWSNFRWRDFFLLGAKCCRSGTVDKANKNDSKHEQIGNGCDDEQEAVNDAQK